MLILFLEVCLIHDWQQHDHRRGYSPLSEKHAARRSRVCLIHGLDSIVPWKIAIRGAVSIHSRLFFWSTPDSLCLGTVLIAILQTRYIPGFAGFIAFRATGVSQHSLELS